MASLSSINILFRADLTQFSSEMQNVTRQLQRTGREMKQLGKSLSLSLTLPIVGLGVASVKTFADLEKLQKGLESVMGSSEKAAAEFELLKEVAKLPGLGLEEAVRGSVNLQAAGFSAKQARQTLLAFGNALATVGKGARELDLVNLALTQLNNKSSGFGQDLRQLTEQLPQLRGALKDAFGTNNTEEISKMGISGAEVVQRLTAEFAKLPKVTGGINNAFENLGDALKISLAGIGEEINKAFDLEGLSEKISNGLSALIEKFQALDPELKKTIIVFAGVAAAVGPVLLAIGALTTALPAVITGFTLMAGPVGLVVAGVAAIIALVAYNWDDVRASIAETTTYFHDLYKESMLVRLAIESLVVTFKYLYSSVKLAFSMMFSSFKAAMSQAKVFIGFIGDIMKALLTGNLKVIPNILLEANKKMLSASVKSAIESRNLLKEYAKDTTLDYQKAVNAVLGRQKYKIPGKSVDANAIGEDIATTVLGGFKKGVEAIKRVKLDDIVTPTNGGTQGNTNQAFDNEIAKIREFIQLVATTPQQVADAKKQIEALEFQKALALDPTSLLIIPDPKELEKGLNRMLNVYQGFKESMVDIGKVIAETVNDFKQNLAEGLGEMIGQVVTGTGGLSNIFKGLLGIVGDFMSQLGKSLIAVGLASEAFKSAFANPYLAIAAGVGLVALGAIFKSIMSKGVSGTPAFAEGGIVGGNSYYGDKILARLNSGELVANRAQQKNLWGMINPSVTASDVAVRIMGGFEIEGDKLKLVLDRANNSSNRRR